MHGLLGRPNELRLGKIYLDHGLVRHKYTNGQGRYRRAGPER